MRAAPLLPCLLILLLPWLSGCAPRTGPITWAAPVDGLGPLPLSLDLARPEGPGPHPAVLLLHAGGWRNGDLYHGGLKQRMAELADAGFVAVTIDYRLTDSRSPDGHIRSPWPAQIADARCAVRWMRANATAQGIDPDRIAASGWSAGGHLALMLAVAPQVADLDDGSCALAGSAAVQAAVSRAGPADLPFMAAHTTGLGRDLLVDLFDLRAPLASGVRPRPALQASPSHWLSPQAPPILQIQGDEDRIVPPGGARRFHQRMRAEGVDGHLLLIEGGSHLLVGKKLQAAKDAELDFLKAALQVEDPLD